jgi:hypothetical protein
LTPETIENFGLKRFSFVVVSIKVPGTTQHLGLADFFKQQSRSLLPESHVVLGLTGHCVGLQRAPTLWGVGTLRACVDEALRPARIDMHLDYKTGTDEFLKSNLLTIILVQGSTTAKRPVLTQGKRIDLSSCWSITSWLIIDEPADRPARRVDLLECRHESGRETLERRTFDWRRLEME